MKSETWREVEEHLLRVLALDPEGRYSYLEQTFGDDPARRRLLEAMLAAEQEMGSFLELGAEPEWLDLPELEEGQRIGPYRVLSELGKGGMSVVYLARHEEYGRQVALKVIKRGMDSNEVLRRFFSERKILANLKHPSIAQLYDGGSTPEGLPYFVMEQIEGRSIDDYCDQNRLGIDERLDLFRQICSAVHHAHQNLVVHRDIKPGNILVTGEGLPKLLDFGIAKVLNPQLAAAGQEPTAAWMRLMTPSYASPEQMRGGPITTASDVYSLGVLLFELLTGVLPRRAPGTSISGSPSGTPAGRFPDGVGSLRPSLAAISPRSGESGLDESMRRSEARGLSPQKLARRLRGDLDRIILKALREQPEERYSSVVQMAEDLRRSQAGMTILAREDSFAYRAKTFLRRHKLAAATGALVIVFSLAFAMMSRVQAAKVEVARQQTEQVSEFLVNLFDTSSAGLARGDSISARELLDRGSSRVDRELEAEPRLRAALLRTIGQAYSHLRSFDQAIDHFERSLEILTGEEGHLAPEIAEIRRQLGVAQTGAGLYEKSEISLQQALGDRRALGEENSSEIAAILDGMARLRSAQGRFPESAELARQTVRLRRELLGEQDVATIFSLTLLAESLVGLGDYEEAEKIFRQAIKACRQSVGEDPELARALNNLAYLLVDRGALEEAELLIREGLDIRRRLFGEQHPIFAESLAMMAFLHRERGHFAAAIPLHERTIEMYREFHGPGHPAVVRETFNLAEAVLENGVYEEAEKLFREALTLALRVVADDHPRVVNLHVSLGVSLHAQGRLDEAEIELESAHARLQRALGEQHPLLASARLELAAVRVDKGELSAAGELLELAWPVLEKVFDADHRRLAQARSELASVLIGEGKLEKAREQLEACQRILRQGRGGARIADRFERARRRLEGAQAALGPEE